MLRLLVAHRSVTLGWPHSGLRFYLKLVLVLLSAGLYASCSPEGNPEDDFVQPEFSKSIEESGAFTPDSDWPLFQRRTQAVSYPGITFLGPDLEDIALSDFTGQIIVLNFWATWCGPCREEMPSLDRLQAAFDPAEVVVIALSNDRKGPEVVLPFLASINVDTLQPYYEKDLVVSRAFDVQGYPTTVILGGNGQEIGRVVAPAVWDGDQAMSLINRELDALRR